MPTDNSRPQTLTDRKNGPNCGVPGDAPHPRRTFLRQLAGSVAALALAPLAVRGADAQSEAARSTSMIVYKDPNCGCCKDWITHVEKADFKVTSLDTTDMDSIKKTMGVPTTLASCHTAVVGRYLFEGHVPADVILQFLREKPVALGLAVPGMPMGSPGMEGPRKDPYKVILFERSGKTRVYASR